MIKEPLEIDDNILEHMKSLTLLCVEDDEIGRASSRERVFRAV